MATTRSSSIIFFQGRDTAMIDLEYVHKLSLPDTPFQGYLADESRTKYAKSLCPDYDTFLKSREYDALVKGKLFEAEKQLFLKNNINVAEFVRYASCLEALSCWKTGAEFNRLIASRSIIKEILDMHSENPSTSYTKAAIKFFDQVEAFYPEFMVQFWARVRTDSNEIKGKFERADVRFQREAKSVRQYFSDLPTAYRDALTNNDYDTLKHLSSTDENFPEYFEKMIECKIFIAATSI